MFWRHPFARETPLFHRNGHHLSFFFLFFCPNPGKSIHGLFFGLPGSPTFRPKFRPQALARPAEDRGRRLLLRLGEGGREAAPAGREEREARGRGEGGHVPAAARTFCWKGKAMDGGGGRGNFLSEDVGREKPKPRWAGFWRSFVSEFWGFAFWVSCVLTCCRVLRLLLFHFFLLLRGSGFAWVFEQVLFVSLAPTHGIEWLWWSACRLGWLDGVGVYRKNSVQAGAICEGDNLGGGQK